MESPNPANLRLTRCKEGNANHIKNIILDVQSLLSQAGLALLPWVSVVGEISEGHKE